MAVDMVDSKPPSAPEKAPSIAAALSALPPGSNYYIKNDLWQFAWAETREQYKQEQNVDAKIQEPAATSPEPL